MENHLVIKIGYNIHLNRMITWKTIRDTIATISIKVTKHEHHHGAINLKVSDV